LKGLERAFNVRAKFGIVQPPVRNEGFWILKILGWVVYAIRWDCNTNLWCRRGNKLANNISFTGQKMGVTYFIWMLLSSKLIRRSNLTLQVPDDRKSDILHRERLLAATLVLLDGFSSIRPPQLRDTWAI
jgi:hypothetical protein